MSAWDRILEAIIFIMLAAAVITLTMKIVEGFGMTGPGCPVDPRWLGYCSDIELQ
jgi:hypothetical protein